MKYIDPEKGEHKPIDIYKFLLSGEYDQGDVALVSYDDLYDMVYDEGRRQSIIEALKYAYANPGKIPPTQIKE